MADVNTNGEPTPQAQTEPKQEPKQEPTKQTEPTKGDPKQQPKYTDADVDALIGKKFAKWQEQQEAKIAEAAKLAEMNAQQKAEYERDQLQKELDDLRRKDAVSGMMAESRKQLQEKGISGIIPACAGNRSILPLSDCACRDHPRVCGEQYYV